MSLFELIDKYRDLLDKKDQLKEETKENNKEIEKVKNELFKEMTDNECPSISRNGFKYTLIEKICYSKKSEADLAAAGLDFFEVLRNEGFGDLVQETVNTRTMQSALKEYVEENDELSEGMKEVINSYDTFDISRRKAKTTASKK